MPYPVPIPVPPFPTFQPGAPVVPKLYWDALSQEQRIHRLCQELHRICDYANALGTAINFDHGIIDQLEADFEKFKESGFEDYYAEQLEQWLRDNAELIMQDLFKMVWFGLTSDGHFCAYVPESWSDIQFDTGAVYGQFDYGRLILRYNVDGSGVIDNTGRYDDANTESLIARIAHLEQTVYTALAQGGH